MELLQVQEELNIVIQLIQQQEKLISDFITFLGSSETSAGQGITPRPGTISRANRPVQAQLDDYRHTLLSHTADSATEDLDKLHIELMDLQALLDNANNLVTRTVQLVNLRLEDHGKAILVFTIVTIIFLPLNFVSSFFGMNVVDIRNMTSNQGLFWIVAACVTVGVVGASMFLAFSGGSMIERFVVWKDSRPRAAPQPAPMPRESTADVKGFRVFGVDLGKDSSWSAE